MKNSKVTLLIFVGLVLSSISVINATVHSVLTRDSVSIKPMQDNNTQSEKASFVSVTAVRDTAKQNFMRHQMMAVLPEVFQSVGFTEAKMNVAFKQLSKAISKKIVVLSRYEKKSDFSSDEKMVKRFLSDMGVKIGGTKFETRKLSPEFVSAFTPENLKQLSVVFSFMKLQYDKAYHQTGFSSKLDAMLAFTDIFSKRGDTKLFVAFTQEYSKWLLELMPGKNKPAITVLASTDSIKKAQDKRNSEIFKNAYTLKPEQIKLSSLPYLGGNGTKLVSILRGENETRVTMAVPIHFNGNWISTDSTFYIKDLQTNDKYFPRSVANEIPLHRVIIVNNCARTMLEITYIFPPLKKSVAIVDILDANKSTLEIPSNAAESTQFRNILIDTPLKEGQEIR